MDNLTHALAGIVTAEIVVQARRKNGATVSPPWARGAWAVSILGHNLPDADALYTGITHGKLGYLLHHRGHTHTLLAAPLIALLSYALVAAWARHRKHVFGPSERGWLALLAMLGPVGHMLLDTSNDYGTHPFWPLNNHWFYGDTIFIMEPLFWACTIPFVVAASSSKWARGFWSLVLLAGVVFAWTVRLVSWPAALLFTIVSAATIVVARRNSPGARIAFSLVANLFVLSTFALASQNAAANAREVLTGNYPHWETLDLARTPRPATPLCWNMIAVQRSRDGTRYALRVADVSAWPSFISASSCSRGAQDTTATLVPSHVSEPALQMRGELESTIASLRSQNQFCEVAAYLRWSRAPFLLPQPDGSLIVGDLRYDRETTLGFSEINFEDLPNECPRFVPPWSPPRLDLIAPNQASEYEN